MHQFLLAASTTQMALPNGDAFKVWALGFVGVVAILATVAGVVAAIVQKAWGALVTVLVGGAISIYACFATDQFVAMLKGLAALVFG